MEKYAIIILNINSYIYLIILLPSDLEEAPQHPPQDRDTTEENLSRSNITPTTAKKADLSTPFRDYPGRPGSRSPSSSPSTMETGGVFPGCRAGSSLVSARILAHEQRVFRSSARSIQAFWSLPLARGIIFSAQTFSEARTIIKVSKN